ncbi:MAG TPA: radical SAM family heme chaperone HemW [Phycisphaerae bacterium]|nr:radical SAM family heme chaperone HemW [Phycisphaerae bacterium]
MTTLSLSSTAPATIPPALRNSTIDALYLHVPFCSSKCHYCDFYSLAGHLDRADAFLAALDREMRLHHAFFGTPAPQTIFIGGGTPTLLPPHQLERLLTLLRAFADTTRLHEFTIEANPNTFTPQTARLLRSAGVNRISFGAQSFNTAELAILQRDHDPGSVAPAFDTARNAGITNLNLDLIFGIPGQTLASWEHSLAQALELDPSHMSCYSLIYEPNTTMTARMKQGEFERLDEETELSMFEHVYHRLRAAGFSRYEVSNYAQDSPCHHNLAYWKARNWLGLGPSAGSHFAPIDGTHAYQWKNAGSLAHYLEGLGEGAAAVPMTQFESLPRAKWAAAAAVFWLRLAEGLEYKEFAARTGVNPAAALEGVLAPFAAQGFAELTRERARLTESGVAVSDHILKRVLAAMEQNASSARRAAADEGVRIIDPDLS